MLHPYIHQMLHKHDHRNRLKKIENDQLRQLVNSQPEQAQIRVKVSTLIRQWWANRQKIFKENRNVGGKIVMPEA